MHSYNDSFFQNITTDQYKLLKKIAYSLSNQTEVFINQESDICTPAFTQDFTDRLKLYHALHENVLNKKAFEFAFSESNKFSGFASYVTLNSVHPGADVMVGDVPFSLKTEAASNISEGKIRISKLMEAAWIRDCQNIQDYISGIHQRLVPHLNSYARILVLRAFRIDQENYRYKLIEIHKDLLMCMANASPHDFSTVTAKKSTTAKIINDGNHLFTLRFDGSVEKITVQDLKAEYCFTHGEWIIPIIGKAI